MSIQKKPGFNDTQKRKDESASNSISTQKDKSFPQWFTSGTIRRLLKTRSECNCPNCFDSGIHYNYEIEALQEEIKSTQKSIAHCKEDTNKILSKVQKLEAYFQ